MWKIIYPYYTAGFVQKNRDEYYTKLRDIAQKNWWIEWIIYFLNAVEEQSRINMVANYCVTNKVNFILYKYLNCLKTYPYSLNRSIISKK
jgi:hypothetical protein